MPSVEFRDGCLCAGSGYFEVARTKWQGLIPVSTEMAPDIFAAQHTYTRACDGFHPPGPCPQAAIDAYQEASDEIRYLAGD